MGQLQCLSLQYYYNIHFFLFLLIAVNAFLLLLLLLLFFSSRMALSFCVTNALTQCLALFGITWGLFNDKFPWIQCLVVLLSMRLLFLRTTSFSGDDWWFVAFFSQLFATSKQQLKKKENTFTHIEWNEKNVTLKKLASATVCSVYATVRSFVYVCVCIRIAFLVVVKFTLTLRTVVVDNEIRHLV